MPQTNDITYFYILKKMLYSNTKFLFNTYIKYIEHKFDLDNIDKISYYNENNNIDKLKTV